MFRLTRKAGYGLMALKYLAEHAQDAPLRARDIAEACHIPLPLLAKSLQRLARTRIVSSHAGMSGGYSLRKPPQQIAVFEVISAIDGAPLKACCGAKETNDHPALCCTKQEPLARVNASIVDLLRSISISDLEDSPPDVLHLASARNLKTCRPER